MGPSELVEAEEDQESRKAFPVLGGGRFIPSDVESVPQGNLPVACGSTFQLISTLLQSANN